MSNVNHRVKLEIILNNISLNKEEKVKAVSELRENADTYLELQRREGK